MHRISIQARPTLAAPLPQGQRAAKPGPDESNPATLIEPSIRLGHEGCSHSTTRRQPKGIPCHSPITGAVVNRSTVTGDVEDRQLMHWLLLTIACLSFSMKGLEPPSHVCWPAGPVHAVPLQLSVFPVAHAGVRLDGGNGLQTRITQKAAPQPKVVRLGSFFEPNTLWHAGCRPS